MSSGRRRLLRATVEPWAAYVIARDHGDEIRQQANAYRAVEAMRPIGEQMLRALEEMEAAGAAQMEAHQARISGLGSSELPRPAGERASKRPPSSGLTAGEVAERLQLTSRQVTNLCRPGGALSATKVRGAWLIDEVSVTRLEERRGHGSDTE